jgi:hypothetical protein
MLTDIEKDEALKIELNKKEIDKFRNKTERRYSDADKYAYSNVVLRMPILPRLELDYEEDIRASDDFEVELNQAKKKKRRVLSADAIREPGF